MAIPKNASSYFWSAVGGAAICALIGFTWGGWVTGGSAQKQATSAAHEAVVAALAPICVERFNAQSDAAAKVVELAKASSWDRGNVIGKSGYATMPGAKDFDSDVARSCAELLANPPKPKA
jgi:alpha/beta superfamily hydrolase